MASLDQTLDGSWNREGKMVESTTPALLALLDDLVAALAA